MCEHSPVTGDDCKPHKSLRTTIKVFLRTEEKKRATAQAKIAKATPPETPVEAPTPAPAAEAVPNERNTEGASTTEPEKTAGSEVPPANDAEEAPNEPSAPGQDLPQEDQDVPQQSIEVRRRASEQGNQSDIITQDIAPGQEPKEGEPNVDEAKPEDANANEEAAATTKGAFGMPGMMPGMGMMAQGGDMNQMQQMQMMMAMQSGMPFGGFPMMGMFSLHLT